MSLLSTKLKSKTSKGKAIIGSISVDRTMKTLMNNHGQEMLLREKTKDFEKVLQHERKNSRREQNHIRHDVIQLRKVSLSTDEWLGMNRGIYDKWKNRERNKLEDKHGRLSRHYKKPDFMKISDEEDKEKTSQTPRMKPGRRYIGLPVCEKKGTEDEND